RLCDVTGDALSDLQPNRPNLVALDDARDELAPLVVEQVERRAIGFDGVVDLLEDELEERIEIERGAEREADLAERDTDAPLACELLLCVGEASFEERDAHVELPARGAPGPGC